MIVMISAVFLVLHHEFPIGVDGAIPLYQLDLIQDMGAVMLWGFFMFVEMLVLRDVVTGLAGVLVHVYAVEINGLHLLLHAHQLSLALALRPVVVVVLARRTLHLLAALNAPFGCRHTGEQGVADC